MYIYIYTFRHVKKHNFNVFCKVYGMNQAFAVKSEFHWVFHCNSTTHTKSLTIQVIVELENHDGMVLFFPCHTLFDKIEQVVLFFIAFPKWFSWLHLKHVVLNGISNMIFLIALLLVKNVKDGGGLVNLPVLRSKSLRNILTF